MKMKKNTKWLLENKINYKRIFENKGEKKLDFVIESLIENRNLSLDTNFDFNPFDLKDIDIAVKRIFEAIENNEKIYIYGDYDVDGITSVSLLYLALSELGGNIHYYIPLRDEGYGLNKDAIQSLKEEEANLVISVDCGINSIEEINLANELGLDFIITDHHEIIGDLPKAFAVINPKREENIYSYKYLAGVGTAFMLVYALYSKLDRLNDLEKFLDIVAIGTVADIVPLTSDNRKFVKRGLKLLNNTKWIGIKQLLRKVFPEDWDTREYCSYDVGYLIAPIFNAAGRLEDAKQAVSLFIEEDGFECLTIIEQLLENNNERKNIQKLYNKNLILVANKSFHHGVIGIVASKILDKYYKPSIIMEIKESEEVATASCRSIDGLNIVECLNSVSDILVKYGGHSGAAGFTIKIENIEEFYQRVDKYIGENFPKELFIKTIKIENILAPYKVNYEFLRELEILEPYGVKNHTPIFAFKNCEYENLRFTRNSTEHLMLDIKKDNYYFKNCIFFGGGDYYDIIANSKKIDVAFNTVVYPKRPDIDNPLNIVFNDYGLAITKDRTIIENIDVNLANILKVLKNEFNYNFSVEIEKKYLKTENINLHLKIDIDKDIILKTFPVKDALIFQEIKKELISDFDYNSIQKKVLASIFKDKKATLAIIEKGRGIRTIIETIKKYYLYKGKTISINDSSNKADFYIFTFDFENEVKLENVMQTLEKINSNNILIISNKEFELSNFNVIKDEYTVAKNIEYITYDEIDKIKKSDNFYYPFLTNEEKIKILALLNKEEKIFSTKEIIIHL